MQKAKSKTTRQKQHVIKINQRKSKRTRAWIVHFNWKMGDTSQIANRNGNGNMAMAHISNNKQQEALMYFFLFYCGFGFVVLVFKF